MLVGDTYQITIADSAFADIQEALSFLGNVSKDAAKRLNQRIKEVILSLAEFPFRFESVNMPTKIGYDFRKATIENRYLLIYAIKEDLIVVERLIDARQGFSSLLKG